MLYMSVLILSFLFLLQASRFRRLVGTMTPPDDSDEAEIYVEGESTHTIDYIYWCKKLEKWKESNSFDICTKANSKWSMDSFGGAEKVTLDCHNKQPSKMSRMKSQLDYTTGFMYEQSNFTNKE